MPHHPHSRRRLLVIVSAAAAVLAVLVGVGVYGLVRGPTDHDNGVDRSARDASPPPASSASSASTAAEALPAALPRTTDPVRYARAVAEAMLEWDSMSGLIPDDYASVLIADADPSGHETNGLSSDLANYLPTGDTWQQLRSYQVTQSLTIEHAYVPASWPGIVASAGDQLVPGTVAVTIAGIRHRAGVWYGTPAAADHKVSFTVFVACRPAFDRCHLLRLSQLDNPLP